MNHIPQRLTPEDIIDRAEPLESEATWRFYRKAYRHERRVRIAKRIALVVLVIVAVGALVHSIHIH